MKLAYGITVQEGEDPFVTLIEHANDNFNIATTPGTILIISVLTSVYQIIQANFS